MDGGEMPTRDEWLEEQAVKAGSKPVTKFGQETRGQIVQGGK
jgi:hypothetical protein